jgi:type IV pilus assembly protein PilY1
MASGGDQERTKLDIAKDTIKDLISTVGDVKMGVMTFNPNVVDSSPHGKDGHIWDGHNAHGGSILNYNGNKAFVKRLDDPENHVVTGLPSTYRENLKIYVNSITASTFTPLAETLYEAGLYFKGGASYFNDGVTYISPIEYSCQKSYVVYMTDGNPTRDDGYSPYDHTPENPAEPTDPSSYAYKHPKEHNHIFKRVVGDLDADGFEPGGAHEKVYDEISETITGQDWLGTDYLDDVAKYLHNTDLRSDLTGTQNITTYTIGFKVTPQHDLLGRTADVNHGGGQYYTASNDAELADAFQAIVGDIMKQTSSFVAPIVPVSRMEKETAGDKLYLALFQPNSERMWSGNIKKFGVVQSGANIGEIIDMNGYPALDSFDKIKTSSTSYWSTVVDGPDVEKGGIGGVLLDRSTARNIYTFQGTSYNLYDDSNKFDTAHITPAMLGLGSDTTARDLLVNYVHGYDSYYENPADPKGPTAKRPWMLGSFLHSRPLVIHYAKHTPSYIFAGSNDGMLHAFNDYTGEEVWAFIPPDLLGSLQGVHGSNNVPFVDGSPKAYVSTVYDTDGSIQSVTEAIIIFGERRGGNHYYALKVTNPLQPEFLWYIRGSTPGNPTKRVYRTPTNTIATDNSTAYDQLGQSWSTPVIGKVACQSGDTNCTNGTRWVAFIGGGYDTNQDNDPVTAADTMGRAVYVVDLKDGSLVKRFSQSDSAYSTTMTYSIPSDVARVDTDGDGKINRLYVGDTGGRMWRFDIEDPNSANWSGRIIFQSNPGDDTSTGRKIFYPPDVTLERGYEMLFFGTGDREHPDSSVFNRIYAVKDKNVTGTILSETNTPYPLYDVTSDELQTTTNETRRNEILTTLDQAYGWFIKLGTGEKSLAAPVVFYGTAYFTTFSPEEGTDPCQGQFGTARMYALGYQTGMAVFDFDANGTLAASDRSKVIGTAIPSGVIITFIEGTAVAYTGVGGGVDRPELPKTRSVVPIYWRIVF